MKSQSGPKLALLGAVVIALALVLTLATTAAPAGAAGPVGVDENLRLANPEATDISPELLHTKGIVSVWVQLSDQPLVQVLGEDVKQTKQPALNTGQQKDYLSGLVLKQSALSSSVRALGGKELARASKVLNAVAYQVDAGRIKDIAALPGVKSVHIVHDYQIDYSTDPFVAFIGAAKEHTSGVDGTGVRVAVLDSGIDYTHAFFGGPGTLGAYQAAYGTTGVTDPKAATRDGLFPTAKVVDGYDFVGPNWPTGALAPDDDPIACSQEVFGAYNATSNPTGCDGSHGTHVADIILGKSLDGTHVGVAPNASLYSYVVCSQISTSCSGVAMIQGLERAVDPNDDGIPNDAVDVVNMSIGSPYGQLQDDSVLASENAIKFGVTVVTSAGNSSDRPFIVGSPSIAPHAISVAASFDTGAKLYPITAGVVSVGGLHLDWSPDASSIISGPLQFGDGAGGNTLGCSAFAASSLTGKVVLLDRGTCAISIKAANVSGGGGLAAIVANNAFQPPVDLPPGFSYGGGTVTVPAYSIMQADGIALKTVLGSTATIDPSSPASLIENLASYSSRGPSYDLGTIKPDITALADGIMAARAGTGTGWTAFNGTSAAAPTTAGSAALVVQAHPNYAPSLVKAALMNTAETDLYLNSFKDPTYKAPITRIGAGEVRVDKAVETNTLAWESLTKSASLSFGYRAVAAPLTLSKTVIVLNSGKVAQTYKLTNEFRYSNDQASGAVKLFFPATLTVAAKSTKSFVVKMVIDPAKLPAWSLNGGSRGGDGFRLQDVEFDGYLKLDGTDDIHLPWQVLPRRASAVTPSLLKLPLNPKGQATLGLTNPSKQAGDTDVFALTGVSPKMPSTALPKMGDNAEVIDLRAAGVRLVDSATIQFGVSLWGKLAHPAYPGEIDVLVDANNDGTFDHVAWTQESGSFASSGKTIVYSGALPSGPFSAAYYDDADLESGNAILTVPLSQLGLTNTSQFTYLVAVYDNYFTGALTDMIGTMKFSLATPRYDPSAWFTTVPAGGSATLKFSRVPGGGVTSPSQKGFLLLYRNGRPGMEADTILITP